MTRFVELIESGQPAESDFDGQRVGVAMAELAGRCRDQGRLGAEGVWRLERTEVLELEQEAQYRPCGGWRALCALSVGTGVLRAEDECFVPGPDGGGQWLDDADEVRRRLVESFSRWLIPPATAAGLFLAMGIHPLWGLRLARRLHVDAPVIDDPVEGWRDEELLPEEDLAALRKGVFAAISVVMSGLRKLDAQCRYGQEALTGFVSEAITFGRNQIETSGAGLDVLIEDVGDADKAQARSMEFAARELFDGVFVPAGVMRRFDDNTVAVDPDILEKVRVGHLGRDAQRAWLKCFLVEHPGECVA